MACDVVALTLRAADHAPLPSWTPGAHIDVVLPNGSVRQYSLCGDPQDRDTWRVAVLREPNGRGGSAYVHDELHEGETLRVRGPRNHFALEPTARYLFLAGGIGITPILPMLRAASAAGSTWVLYYGGRTRESMAFVDELDSYGERVQLWPQDERGLLPVKELLTTPDDGTLVYCCGPSPLLAVVEQHCVSWPRGALHVERFTASAHAVDEAIDRGEAEQAFEVQLARTGMTVSVPPGVSILAAIEAAGVSVLSSCREGTCGTCETDVLEGTPDHRDCVLDAAERAAGDVMMICVSRARSTRLVLDL